ncbi:UDP-3-O-acylglucosamine N-acyltransferase [Frankliniella fusca]|uniref:UDP-3-O-acylglucosamine N-acyltransferase n=1 Tax=Frankliniella fusca TaxID=407009 RepID=A0AAE1LEA9_9NEOP|nr:UDP-3-O-acylglucosamine N-acyltransferase [Frankliniella fusca]
MGQGRQGSRGAHRSDCNPSPAPRPAPGRLSPQTLHYLSRVRDTRVLAVVVAALASLASAQSFGDFFPGFAAPQSAAAGSGGRSNTGNAGFLILPLSAATAGKPPVRDSGKGRRWRGGPILFPNTPPGSETSGVVVGASGFGFVPPGGRAGGARGVYPSLNGLVAGPNLRPALGPGLSPGLVSTSFRLGPLRSGLGGAGPLGGHLGPLGVGALGVPLGRAPTTRLRPSVSYSTTHGASPAGVSPAGVSPLLWRLPAGRSSSFLTGIMRPAGK